MCYCLAPISTLFKWSYFLKCFWCQVHVPERLTSLYLCIYINMDRNSYMITHIHTCKWSTYTRLWRYSETYIYKCIHVRTYKVKAHKHVQIHLVLMSTLIYMFYLSVCFEYFTLKFMEYFKKNKFLGITKNNDYVLTFHKIKCQVISL